ncbi:ATP-binding protein [Owenweeksia hongkongensis]|uniref:ATP-binding protein n=1 Tax=Owenweeksia hongkongensis TaxID=253245 RepID=UPI003A9456B7
MIERLLASIVQNKLGKGKAIILFGARQTGKTTLLRTLFSGTEKVLWLNGDDPDTHTIFQSASATQLQIYFSGHTTLIIDEAQRIDDIGIKLKLITDQMPDIQLIATGSSSFELANKVNEPLTGRKWEYKLFPISFQEMVNHHGLLHEKRLLNHRLVFGSYPEVVAAESDHREILKQLSDSFLFKDILLWEKIKKSDKLIKLLKALAYQIGQEVSFNEIGKTIGLDNQTVEKYIQLLEQTFVIFRLPAFSRNHRKELKKSRKIYFFDNGIRNALIADFRPAETRNDIGALWENYLISERQKANSYQQRWTNCYFWRTQAQQEIDYIEEHDNTLHTYEFKWNPTKKARLSKTFSNTYPNHTFEVITPENYFEFLS